MVSDAIHNVRAFYGFDRPNVRSLVSRQSARISKGLVFFKAKALLTKFRLAGQINRTLSNSGFFSSIDAVLQTILSTVVGGVESKT